MTPNGRPTTPSPDEPEPAPLPKQEADDLLNEELEDSFPASDPPSSTQPVHPSASDDDEP
jgi:L-lactate dehydrogenase complex protein LldG